MAGDPIDVRTRALAEALTKTLTEHWKTRLAMVEVERDKTASVLSQVLDRLDEFSSQGPVGGVAAMSRALHARSAQAWKFREALEHTIPDWMGDSLPEITAALTDLCKTPAGLSEIAIRLCRARTVLKENPL